MICPFCQEHCRYEGLTPQIMSEKQEEIWICSNHQIKVEHLIRFNRKPNCPCKDWSDQNCCPVMEHYKTVVWVPRKDNTHFLAIIENNQLHIQTFNGIQAWNVMSLDPAPPNLTPESLQKKIPLWVVFS